MWRSASRLQVLLSLCWLTVLPAMAGAASRTLTFEERVEYQRRIEDVYWKHRIWPQENPGPKPALAAVLPEARLRARVEDYLKKSNALEALWERPLTAGQLQAEMERMAKQSQAPEVLREIFAALDDDPFVISETLARQTLADRLIRSWYAHDERFHGDLRRKAEAAVQGVSSGAVLSTLGAEYAETTWELESEDGAEAEPKASTIALDADAWQEQLERLAGLLGTGRDLRADEASLTALPLMTVSALQEVDGGFFVTSVVTKETDSVTVATASWPKEAFDTWWTERSAATSADLAPVEGQLAVAEITATGTCELDTWQPTSDAAPAPRSYHTAVWTGSEMIVWGGYNSVGDFSDGGRYNPSTDTWLAVTAGAPSKRFWHTAVWTGSEMIIWGGFDCTFGDVWVCWNLNSGLRYNPSSDSWVETTTAGAPSPREFHTAVWTGNEMVVWGGGEDSVPPVNTGGRYDPSTDSWVATTTSGAPTARSGHTSVWTGNEMIVWGGYGSSPFNTGGRYDPSADSWVAITTSGAPAARYGHTSVWTGSEMIVWGGHFYDGSEHYLNTGGRYDPSADGWVATTTTAAPLARSGHTAVWTGDEMIVWGGGAGSGFLSTGGRYDPSGDSWAPTTTSGAPTASGPSVWTGSEMIVWGGGTGGRYDPSTDSWVAVTAGAPSRRSLHAAVWTGSEMIVWGGSKDLWPYLLQTGGRYNPSTDSWVATTTSGAPVARTRQTAVWTGSEMIVWGGYGGGAGYLYTGGRYDPTADGWVETTIASGPAARYDHTSAWTGTEMIVWGGYGCCVSGGGYGYLNTGGRYDPTADGWVKTTTASAPAARSGQTAVWTGSEMIVWGGSGGGYLNTGGRFDPSTDSWVATGTSGAPAARYLHTAAWTGSEMIVWGGKSGSSTYWDSGGRYDPTTDSWVQTTTTGAPTARSSPTAVWTGSEMIVWGGQSGSSTYWNSGGRYDPTTDTWMQTTPTSAPTGRSYHTAVWTGGRMIVWGGSGGGYLNTGGLYCVAGCDGPVTWYLDADGDGYGASSTGVASCTQPPGYVTPGADNCPSVANGLQLDTDSDLVGDACDCAPEDPGNSTMLGPAEHLHFTSKTDLVWDPPADGGGGLVYDVLRGGVASDWETATCLETEITATAASDTETPGGAFFYLVRVKSECGDNTGSTSDEVRRVAVACEPERVRPRGGKGDIQGFGCASDLDGLAPKP